MIQTGRAFERGGEGLSIEVPTTHIRVVDHKYEERFASVQPWAGNRGEWWAPTLKRDCGKGDTQDELCI